MSTPWFQLVGPSRNVQLFGIRLLGVDALNGRKVLFTAVFFLLLYLLSRVLGTIARAEDSRSSKRLTFWTRQGISLVTFVLGALGFVSIWFDNPARLATGVGLVGAGLAFALQKVITSFAGYFVILRGKTFNVGDRITMGGVRGDVVALNFIQTVILEMGQPPAVQSAAPAMWVQSRQYTGRIVTVSNAKIFEDPVYNYTRDFPYIWEEMHVAVDFAADVKRAEQILLEAARAETTEVAEEAKPAAVRLQQRFLISSTDLEPRVFLRLTSDNVELSVRFLVKDHDIRGLKDRMSRAVLDGLNAAGIAISSGTYQVTGVQPLRVEVQGAAGVGA